jgi:hypothetical protein
MPRSTLPPKRRERHNAARSPRLGGANPETGLRAEIDAAAHEKGET